MLCTVCNQRDAVLLVQQVTVGEKKEVHLCSQCAKDRGLNAEDPKIDKSLETLIKSISDTSVCCYACGLTFFEIERTNRAGCPECYVAFATEIKKLLEKKGIDLPYMGDMPKTLSHFRSILTDRLQVQKKLEISVENEDYEKAALYRDFLRTLDRSPISSADEGEILDK